MEFSKRGAVLGFIGGATGGAVAGLTDFSFLKGTAVAIFTAVVVILLVNFVWERRS